jgi:magnesium transporter
VTSVVVDRREEVEARLASDEFFWLDLYPPTEDDFALLRDVFGFHPLAVEDSERFGQRAKLEHYDDFAFLVVYGWSPDEDGLVEVHCFYSDRFLLTVRRDEAPAFGEVRRLLERDDASSEPILVLHGLVDRLVDSFFSGFAGFDDTLDKLEQTAFSRLTDQELQEIYALKRRLVSMRKAIAPERDLLGALSGGLEVLPGLTLDARPHFRNVYDHLIRLTEMLDAYRDLSTSALDVYLSAASNRLNDVTKQLAVIATIFLPLAFITGFFGQNFDWMVDHVSSAEAFLLLGVGTQVVAVVLLVGFFKWRGWF